MTTRRYRDDTESVDDLYRDLSRLDLQPLWKIDGLMTAEPRPADVAHCWLWSDVRALAERAGSLVPIDRGGDRRALSLVNPGLGGKPFATSTLWGAVQYLGPHEFAPAHSHSPAAVRFVLEGHGAWTAVDGDAVSMSKGDLVLTPSKTLHEHNNPTDEPVLWFDGLDMPIVDAVDAMFVQPGPDELASSAQEMSRSEALLGVAGLVPTLPPAATGKGRLLRYPWDATDRALTNLIAAETSEHVAVRYSSPTAGGDALPTVRCEMHRLLPGARTATTRRAGSSVIVVHRGAGRTVIGGTAFDWSEGDMLSVPSWAPLDHLAHEASDLFVFSDAPTLEALGLDRSLVEDANQPIERVTPL